MTNLENVSRHGTEGSNYDKLDRELDEMLSDVEDGDAPPSLDAPGLGAAAKLRTPTFRSTPAPRTAAKYVFAAPATSGAGADSEAEEHRGLAKLFMAKDATGARMGYFSMRDEFCRRQLALNEWGLRPPAFRTVRKRPRNAVGAEWDTFSKDQMVIDLHWLHKWTAPRQINEEDFPELLHSPSFDFDQAGQYASKVWTTEIRVLRLALSGMDQWQLSVLVSSEVRTRLKLLQDAHFKVQALFRGLSQMGHRLNVTDAVDFARLWFAAELAHGAGQDAVAQVHGWMRGTEPLTRTTISQKLRRMRLWVAKAGL